MKTAAFKIDLDESREKWIEFMELNEQLQELRARCTKLGLESMGRVWKRLTHAMPELADLGDAG